MSSILSQTADAESDLIINEGSVDWELGENGWIIGGRDGHDLLLWTPPDHRRTLLSPQNTVILSCEFSTKLDFTGAALGERWMECFSQ